MAVSKGELPSVAVSSAASGKGATTLGVNLTTTVQVALTDTKAREYLTKFNVPADLVQAVPLAKFTMIKDLTPRDLADFQKFVDLGVEFGVVKGAVDVKSMIKAF